MAVALAEQVQDAAGQPPSQDVADERRIDLGRDAERRRDDVVLKPDVVREQVRAGVDGRADAEADSDTGALGRSLLRHGGGSQQREREEREEMSSHGSRGRGAAA